MHMNVSRDHWWVWIIWYHQLFVPIYVVWPNFQAPRLILLHKSNEQQLSIKRGGMVSKYNKIVCFVFIVLLALQS